ncbi:hypothetical protein ACFSC4_14130 [Deinococcus malanensis]|uniref:hypothetical protein n=1 Tax=Deinococcus malanensis TaxID=1706855 RepID=UPI00363C29DD
MSITTAGGYSYDTATGRPLFDTKEFWLHPLTPENLAYLILAEGLRVAATLKPSTLTPEERSELMPVAQSLIRVYNRLREGSQHRLRERS